MVDPVARSACSDRLHTDAELYCGSFDGRVAVQKLSSDQVARAVVSILVLHPVTSHELIKRLCLTFRQVHVVSLLMPSPVKIPLPADGCLTELTIHIARSARECEDAVINVASSCDRRSPSTAIVLLNSERLKNADQKSLLKTCEGVANTKYVSVAVVVRDDRKTDKLQIMNSGLELLSPESFISRVRLSSK